jgi:hypothetical protein
MLFRSRFDQTMLLTFLWETSPWSPTRAPLPSHRKGNGMNEDTQVEETQFESPAIEVLPIEDEVAPELVMFADWPTYEGAPSGS